MVGSDKSTELWRHLKSPQSFFIYASNAECVIRQDNWLYATIAFDRANASVTILFYYLAICNKEHLTSSIILCQCRFKIVPNNK